jgi:hypothetical protein
MAPKGKAGSATSADNTAADSSRSDTKSADSASDNIRLVMEQLQSLHTGMDEHARTQSELLRRDALRDHPIAIGIVATPHLDTPYMLPCEFVSTLQREQTHRGSIEATIVGSQSTLTSSP